MHHPNATYFQSSTVLTKNAPVVPSSVFGLQVVVQRKDMMLAQTNNYKMIELQKVVGAEITPLPLHRSRPQSVITHSNHAIAVSSKSVVSPTLRQQSKSVSFDPKCRAKRTIHLKDYTADDISSCWYTERELSEQRRKSVRIISKIAEGGGKAGNYCVRGLDRLTPKAAEERYNVQLDVYLAVLREQHTQYLTGKHDVEAIAQKYRDVSAARHQEAAYQVGLCDAMIARRIFFS